MSEQDEKQTPSVAALPRFYCNFVKITHSVYDFQIVLGTQSAEVTSDEMTTLVEPKVLVHMSPQHVRVVAEMLQEQLRKYESVFGAIPTSGKTEPAGPEE